MTKTDFVRTSAAVICTLVMSATCVLGAVGPAQGRFGAASTPTPVQRSIA